MVSPGTVCPLPPRTPLPSDTTGATIIDKMCSQQHTAVIGVARWVQWVHLHPQGGENFFSGLIYRKMRKCTPQDTKCTPQPKQESIFRPVYAGWLRLEVPYI